MDVAAAGRVLTRARAHRLWPGAVAAAGRDGTVEAQWVDGWAEDWGSVRRPLTAATVFDLASLTKILVTTPAVLLLARRGALGLDDPVTRPGVDVDPRVTVRHLLTHTSGLPAHRRFDDRARSPRELAAAAAATPLEDAPGTTVRYSDLGFVLLGATVEAVAGEPLDAFAEREVLAPLGSHATFRPRGEDVAATEVVRGRPVRGRVHDENAAAAGGAVGHAGLFGALGDVRACLPLWRPGGPLLDDHLRAEAQRDHGLGRGLGWTCRAHPHDLLSPGWGPAAVSHTGFTGTSVALDPATGRWAVLLTNAVHYGRGRPGALAARRAFHAALVGD